MPINKNAQLRHKILDECFSNKFRNYTIYDLMKAVNEKFIELYGDDVWKEHIEDKTIPRQLRSDIAFMRNTYNAPIEAEFVGLTEDDGKIYHYKYTDPEFTIFKSELSTEEITKLLSTIEMLGKYRGTPNYSWLEEMISTMECRFGIKPNTKNIVTFAQNEQLKGLEFLSQIIDAITEQRALKITYKTYSGRTTKSVIHPYHLKQYNNRWFLFGLESINNTNKISNRALDRIEKITPSYLKYIPTDIDFTTFFDDIVGVTKEENQQVFDVQLRFSENRFNYVVTKPIHHTQTILDETKRIIQLKVRFNKELEAEILRYGKDCEVIEPKWLRNRIADNIKEALSLYTTESIPEDKQI